jgi:hypothetical protein
MPNPINDKNASVAERAAYLAKCVEYGRMGGAIRKAQSQGRAPTAQIQARKIDHDVLQAWALRHGCSLAEALHRVLVKVGMFDDEPGDGSETNANKENPDDSPIVS